MNFFNQVPLSPPDPIFGVNAAFNADLRTKKANLAVGSYLNESGQPLVLTCVRQAEELIMKQNLSKEYLPIEGDPLYIKLLQRLVFGSIDLSMFGAQTVGGTGALRLGTEFLHSIGFERLALIEPTWANHRRIFTYAGLDVTPLKSFAQLKELPKKSIVLLQACCHNPTGKDPSMQEWEEIAALMSKYELFPFFDLAYQGLGKGLEADRAAIEIFACKGLEFFVAVSLSKNFGLYGERVGALFAVTKNASEVGSCLKQQIRSLYSNPPCHGSRIVAAILSDERLMRIWTSELNEMRKRIGKMRTLWVSKLNEVEPEYGKKVAAQVGMFAFLPLPLAKIKKLRAAGIYTPDDGRINLASLNENNIDWIAKEYTAIL